ncbi:glycoside hydrolase family 15 protein [Micromonospora phytophila]|uniref:glycoside hydrolase family 15 protein n=1 Tax=Micromonospora phytophila TaxID=709888 RepID=UPI00202EEDAB|nr:glycoside hydrolase family 15 protein [Micromonospora phytophila]MCM0677620.1 glycoside hydrolase family 15 protein [Micromonospora phytophila]
MDDYPAVEDHGLIGDLQTAALVARDGTLDWFCAPRFDSPSLFAGLLDRQRGGYFKISPHGVDYVSKQLYLPGTPILITRFLSADGVGEVVDFMPLAGETPTDRHCIVRMVRVVRGEMTFRMDCQPRFNYGRDEHTVDFGLEGTVFRSREQTLTVNPVRHDGMFLDERDFKRDGRGVCVVGTLRQGFTGGLVLHTASPEPPRVVHPDEVSAMFVETRDFWRRWLDRSRYTGRWREMVERSAMTLKLMTYAPTGALVAAPTAGLPERIGGARNWDYRYTWIRDASFSVHALLGLGFDEEARRYLHWINERVRDSEESGEPIQIVYRVDGGRDLTEEPLDHLEGYRGSGPVRVGNDAAGQFQLDIYGETMNCMHLADSYGLRSSHDEWRNTVRMMDWLCEHWDQPEDGIWETRAGRRDFTYGRLMSWVAFDRAIRLARRHGRPGHLARWAAARDAAYDQIMSRGFHRGRGAFVQHYETDVLDASLLSMAAVGFVAPTDPMWQSTLRAMDADLVSDSLVYRYDPGAAPDGLPGAEGTFTMCTFWYVQALAQSSRLDDARLAFEKMLTYSSQLGLYSEEIAPSGEQIGNFPQAFSHLSLISTATVLDEMLDARRDPS